MGVFIIRLIFIKVLDTKRRASNCTDEMASKEFPANGRIVYFSHLSWCDFAQTIIFYSLLWNITPEKEYFAMQILKNIKTTLFSAKHDVCLNSGSQRTLVHLTVRNVGRACVRGRAVLTSFHKQHSVAFCVNRRIIFLN